MRTRVKGLGQGLQRLAMLVLVATIAVGCGKDNTSGKNKNDNIWGGGFGTGGGVYGGGNGNHLPSNWLDIVSQENPCAQGGNRAQVQLPVNATVNVGALYVGVTSYGDIAITQNQGGAAVMRLYICPRAGLTGQGDLTSQPVVENSPYCPIGQVTAANVQLGSQYGQPYTLGFRPIHIPGTGVYSSLCQDNYYY